MNEQPLNSITARITITPKTLGVALVVAALCFGAGYAIGAHADRLQIQKEVLSEVFGDAIHSNTLSGRITDVAKNKGTFTVEISSLYGVNIPAAYRKKVVHINGATVMSARRNKGPEVFNREVEAFRQQQDNQLGPPLPYVEGKITLDDLRAGYQATFMFAPHEGLSILDNEFTATHIDVTR